MAQSWDAEIEVDEKQARRLIEGQFPRLAPASIERIGQGFDNTVFRVNGEWVFRFPRRSIALELMESELALLPAVGELGLPLATPRPVFVGRPSAEYGWPFVGYSDVRGRTPGVLGAATRARSVGALASFLRALHRFPVARALELGAPPDRHDRLNANLRREPLAERMEKARELGLWREPGLWHAYKEKWLPMIAELGCPEPEEERVLAHGDLHFRNVLADEEGLLSGIIDWGDLHVGHRAIDLQFAYSFVPPECRPEFFRIYGDCDERTARFARFRAILTSSVLLLYAHDLGDADFVDAAWQSLACSLA